MGPICSLIFSAPFSAASTSPKHVSMAVFPPAGPACVWCQPHATAATDQAVRQFAATSLGNAAMHMACRRGCRPAPGTTIADLRPFKATFNSDSVSAA